MNITAQKLQDRAAARFSGRGAGRRAGPKILVSARARTQAYCCFTIAMGDEPDGPRPIFVSVFSLGVLFPSVGTVVLPIWVTSLFKDTFFIRNLALLSFIWNTESSSGPQGHATFLGSLSMLLFVYHCGNVPAYGCTAVTVSVVCFCACTMVSSSL